MATSVELHSQLLKKLRDYIDDDEFQRLKAACNHWIVPAIRQRIKTPNDLLEQLQKGGHIKVGKYEKLFELLVEHQLEGLKDDVEDIATKVAEALDAEAKNVNQSIPRLKRQSTGDTSLSPDAKAPKTTKLEYSREKRGLVLIINNKKFERASFREGSDKDVKNVEKLFKKTLSDNYTVLSGEDYQDCTLNKMKYLLKDAQQQLKTGKFDQFFCFIFSHGDEKGILSHDELRILPDEVVTYFKTDAVTEMAKHPKVFIFQACRGGQKQSSVRVDNQNKTLERMDSVIERDSMVHTVPVDANVVTAYSTTKGFFSYRNIFEGSWFIRNICEVFSQYHQEEHLLDLLTRVHHEVSLKTSESESGEVFKQMPSFDSTFTQKMFLHHS